MRGDITALIQSFTWEGGCCMCVVRSPKGWEDIKTGKCMYPFYEIKTCAVSGV